MTDAPDKLRVQSQELGGEVNVLYGCPITDDGILLDTPVFDWTIYLLSTPEREAAGEMVRILASLDSANEQDTPLEIAELVLALQSDARVLLRKIREGAND